MAMIVTRGLLIVLLVSCIGTSTSNHEVRTQSERELGSLQEDPRKVIVSLQEIDLSKIGHIAPKGRVQDKDYNELPVVDQLIANGKESIPFLISKIEDETKINESVMDYWSDVCVGDVAHIILNNFLLDSTWEKATIPGVGWKNFLACTNPELNGELCLRDYITRFGRKSLKLKWQKVWNENKGRLYWDEADRSFRLKAS